MKINLNPIRINGRPLTRRQREAVEMAVFMAKIISIWTVSGVITYWLVSVVSG